MQEREEPPSHAGGRPVLVLSGDEISGRGGYRSRRNGRRRSPGFRATQYSRPGSQGYRAVSKAGDEGDFETAHFSEIGALVLGRRMADLGIGPWGEEPTFHAPCFVVTHRPAETIVK